MKKKKHAEPAKPVYISYTEGDRAIPRGWYWERGTELVGPFKTKREAENAAPRE